MSGEEGGELADMVANSETESQDQLQQGYVEDNGQAERLTTTSNTTSQQPSGEKLLAGKYKNAQELEKAYLNQNKGYNQIRSKSQQLEAMLQNPRFQQMAAQDPEMRQALAKLGYQLQEEESREDERTGGGAWDGNTNSPDFKIAVLEHKQQLFVDRLEFQEELGRKLSGDEWNAVRQQIVRAPRLSVKEAWKLTPHYEKEIEAKQAKALEAAQRRAPINRPRPVANGGLSGPNGPKGKSPLGLKEEEKGDFLRDLMDKADRS